VKKIKLRRKKRLIKVFWTEGEVLIG